MIYARPPITLPDRSSHSSSSLFLTQLHPVAGMAALNNFPAAPPGCICTAQPGDADASGALRQPQLSQGLALQPRQLHVLL
jgi:hypothetical protein